MYMCITACNNYWIQIGFACHHSNGGAASETLIVHGVYLHNRGVQHHRKATYREHWCSYVCWRGGELEMGQGRDPKWELYMSALSLGKQECHTCTCIQVYSSKVNWSLSTGYSLIICPMRISISRYMFVPHKYINSAAFFDVPQRYTQLL